MPANLWKSLTVRFMGLGHSLRKAECMAAVIVIDCLVMYTIMGYRFSDAERERSPSICYSMTDTRSMTWPGNCGIVPESVDRDSIPLHCQPDPALPAGCGNQSGIDCTQGIFPASMQDAPVVCW